ncbi:MAG: family 10 glycosylhydrolase [bacterium]
MLVVFAWAVACAAGAQRSSGMREEFRGVWISRFDWCDKNPQVCRKKIENLIGSASRAGFNAVFFQVRGQADTLYPNAFEPWSGELGYRYPGFDPLKYAIHLAHAYGMELHAYVNVFPCCDGNKPPPRGLHPTHPYWSHAAPGVSDSWVCADSKGKPQTIPSEEYVWFSPGNPAVEAHVRMICRDLLTRYEIDGLHFDRIRYPGENFSHDRVSEARFRGAGNPTRLGWEAWQREQVSAFLERVMGEVWAIRPRVKVTAAVWGIYRRDRIAGYGKFSSGYHEFYQDSEEWMRRGLVDAICPMIYWDLGGKKPDYDDLLEDFMKRAHGRHVYGGQKVYSDFAENAREVQVTRQLGAKGSVLFSWGSATSSKMAGKFKSGVYASLARTPAMPWKSQRQTGAILGTVVRKTDRGEVPVTDACIRIEGSPRVWLTGGDGVFSILYLRPRPQTALTVSVSGRDTQRVSVNVAGGVISQIKVVLP